LDISTMMPFTREAIMTAMIEAGAVTAATR
jgi:hypothetical protein